MDSTSQKNNTELEELDNIPPKEGEKPNTRLRGRPRKIPDGAGSMDKFIKGGKSPFETKSKSQRSPTREIHTSTGITGTPADNTGTSVTDGDRVNNSHNNEDGIALDNSRNVLEARGEQLLIDRIESLEEQMRNLWNEKVNLEEKIYGMEKEATFSVQRYRPNHWFREFQSPRFFVLLPPHQHCGA
ncbi:hypothetical protein QAD02_012664 [Eretmocerus hayati]|uniref:Uncharacterized protein n=1 Tax=Eretmocerus hayati TaxID=131215 RepID=A0ACC2P0F3_9HYME|nr:hypothetical protein QAD02_012664 [Eretmocerus hayati]